MNNQSGEIAEVHVLLKVRHDDYTTVHAIYEGRADLEARVERIGKANSQYTLRRLSKNHWRVGPDDDEDEGFFGNKPVDLIATTAKFHRASQSGSHKQGSDD